MGGSSSSKSSSSNYSSIDNSYHETNTTTDHGALEVAKSISTNAMDLANYSLESVGVREAQALNAMADFGESAMTKVANSYKESDAETMQAIFKYSAVAAAVIGVAYGLGRK